MIVQTCELIDAGLDWAVAKCEGHSQCVVFGRGAVKAEGLLRPHRLGGVDPMLLRPVHDEWVKKCEGYPWSREQTIWEPSTDWAQGGPIIDRSRIALDGFTIIGQWMAIYYVPDEEPWEMRGPTALIAAMRCYVASKMGDTIDVPDELLK